MMFDVITISDDEEEVQILDHIVHLEKRPPVVDLTATRSKRRHGYDTPPTPPPTSPPSSTSPPDPSPLRQTPLSQPSSPAHPNTPPSQQQHSPSPQLPRTPSPKTRPPSPSDTQRSPSPKIRPPPSPRAYRSPSPQTCRPLSPPTCRPPSPPPHQTNPPQSRLPPSPRPQTPSDYDLMMTKKEMGNKYFRRNMFNEAIGYYRQAAELARRLNNRDMSAIIHFNLAMSYDKLGAYNQAADECAAAVKLNDQYIKAHIKRAEIFMSQGKYEEAVICYEHVCELEATNISKREDYNRRINFAKEMSKTSRKRDQHEILGLRPHFTLDDLRASYKQKARAHHPDKHSDADVVTRRINEKIFKEAMEAYSFFLRRFS